MEPLTTIELETCDWLGILLLAGIAAAEAWTLAEHPGKRAMFTGRERAHRAANNHAPAELRRS